MFINRDLTDRSIFHSKRIAVTLFVVGMIIFGCSVYRNFTDMSLLSLVGLTISFSLISFAVESFRKNLELEGADYQKVIVIGLNSTHVQHYLNKVKKDLRREHYGIIYGEFAELRKLALSEETQNAKQRWLPKGSNQ